MNNPDAPLPCQMLTKTDSIPLPYTVGLMPCANSDIATGPANGK